MESIYLKKPYRATQGSTWFSPKINLKKYFSRYSEQLSVVVNPKSTFNDIFKAISGSREGITPEEYDDLTKKFSPRRFKCFDIDTNTKEEVNLTSTIIENKPSTASSMPSTSLEGIASTSKQYVYSEDCIAEITDVSSQNSNRLIIAEDVTEEVTEKVSGLPSISLEGIASTSKQHDYSEYCISEIIDTSGQDSNNLIIAEEVTGEINLNNEVKKKQRNRVRRPGKKLRTYGKCSKSEISKGQDDFGVQAEQDLTSNGVEIVTQLLDSIFMNLSDDPKMLIVENPPCQNNLDDFNTNTATLTESCEHESKSTLEIADVADNQPVPETPQNSAENPVGNSEIAGRPLRRSCRRRNKKKFEEADSKKSEEIPQNKKLHIAKNKSLPLRKVNASTSIDLYQSYCSTVEEVQMRCRGIRQRKNINVRGQLLVDATNRMGKKDLKPLKNFVVSFRVHKPFKHNVGEKGVRPGKCLQEFQVLNYQTLRDLKEKIVCEADYQDASGEISDWPYLRLNNLAKDRYKSSMFYIDNTFYVDCKEGETDYSEVIREWGKERGIDLGDAVPMDKVKIEDIEVRFGYPYVYVHQGSCEHLIIISDARLLTVNDSLHSSDYPNLTKTARTTVRYCAFCSKNAAKWVVKESDRLISDINYMCTQCFQGFHYIDTKKIGEFKAHRYKQRGVLYH